MMTLYYTPNSPFVRKVRIAAIEKGVNDQISLVFSPPTENSPALHDANPLGKIPALVLDDGQTIFDSPVICEYLDGLSAQNPLVPATGAERLRVRKMEALADGIMDATVARYLEFLRPETERSPRWISRWENAISRSLYVLESGKEKLYDGLDIGSISLAAALGYINLRYPELGWTDTHPKIAAWFAEFSQRQSMKDTAPEV